MYKFTLLFFCFLSFTGISQSKTTGDVQFSNGMIANLTLNNSTGKVTLVLTGPSDRWFGLGIGVNSGFNMGNGDVIVYSNTLSDRNFVGTVAPAVDSSQDWSEISNTVSGQTRTLTLERNLVTNDSNDFSLPYNTTNSISIVSVRSGSASNNLSSNHIYNYSTPNFSTVLDLEDFSLNATSIYPNPAQGEFFVTTKTNLNRINLYNQTGALVKTFELNGNDSREYRMNVAGFQSGVYFMELQNDSEKSWKKVVLE